MYTTDGLALQACIDMNKVMEVARADEVTGNLHSVAITAPDRVHFVKGTCREESTWWLEVLQIFPRSSIKTGRAKRNATFPGGISTTYMAQYAGQAAEPGKQDGEAKVELSKSLLEPAAPPAELAGLEPTAPASKEPKRELADSGSGQTGGLKSEPAQRYKKIKSKTSEGTRAYRSLRSNTCENLSAIPHTTASSSSRLGRVELPATPLVPAPAQPTIQITAGEQGGPPSPASEGSQASSNEGSGVDLPARGVPDGCGLDIALPVTPPSQQDISLQLSPLSAAATQDKPQLSPQIPIPSPHELLNLKKGWLMKRSPAKDWHKHWFVLQGTALMYFRDPSAENNGLLDGIIDLGLVQKVRKTENFRV